MSQTTSRPNHRPPTVSTPQPAAHDTTIIDEMDTFLDEIDQLLEDQEWMTRYVQKSGE